VDKKTLLDYEMYSHGWVKKQPGPNPSSPHGETMWTGHPKRDDLMAAASTHRLISY